MATKSVRVHTPEGVATYVHAFVPRQRTDAKGNPKGDPKYQITIVWDESTDLDELKAAAQTAGEAKFGPKFMNLVKQGKANWPFTDNADRVDEDDVRNPPFDVDGEHCSFKSADKPGIVDADAEPTMDKSDIYSGMRARVSCRPFAYDNESKGVAFYLINIQKLDDGDRLSGNPSAEDDFAPAKGKGKPQPKPMGKTPAKKVKSSIDSLL